MRKLISVLYRLFKNKKAPTRRQKNAIASLICDRSSEPLERRCLLSGMKGHGAVLIGELNPSAGDNAVDESQVEVSLSAARAARKKKVIPNITGSLRVVTQLDGDDLPGTFQFTQNKRKIAGTFTNDGQGPADLKGKIKKVEHKKGDDDEDIIDAAITLRFKHFAISSDTVIAEMHLEVLGTIILGATGGIKAPNGTIIPIKSIPQNP